jgi:hypothetical protein
MDVIWKIASPQDIEAWTAAGAIVGQGMVFCIFFHKTSEHPTPSRVVKSISPLLPTAPALAVATATSPLEVAVLRLLVTITAPPAALVAAPAVNIATRRSHRHR